ncbi:MAG: GAF domain-containing protein [Leptospiraceae bacterium]|nr:GAF domain-containing protein [Leptospiraceae bacterium]
MLNPGIPDNEPERIELLKALGILDTPPENRFERITQLASRICNMPISLMSLVDTNRQWFKSTHGLDMKETPRNLSFCAHAILQNKTFYIEDTKNDERFQDHPMITGHPHIRDCLLE